MNVRLINLQDKEYFRYEDEDSGAIVWLPVESDKQAFESIVESLNKHYGIDLDKRYRDKLLGY